MLTFLCCAFVLICNNGNAEASSWSEKVALDQTGNLTLPDISNDGNTIVCLDIFNTYNERKRELGVVVIEKHDGNWGNPITLASNGIKSDFPLIETRPVISGDGNTIVYLGNDNEGVPRIYALERKNDGTWGQAYIIEAIPPGWFGQYLSIDFKGDTLAYICGNGNGWFGGTPTLYISEKVNDRWQVPIKISNHEGNYSGLAENPCFNDDGTALAWKQANYQCEVFFSKKVNGLWTEPLVLTNSEENEEHITLSGDGSTIFFWRIYQEGIYLTGKDLYAIKNINNVWGNPTKINISRELVSGIYESCPAVDYTGNRVIFNTLVKEEDSISSGYLKIVEYKSNSWDGPRNLTFSDWFFHYYPKLTPDGKNLVFQGVYELDFMSTSIEPPGNSYIPPINETPQEPQLGEGYQEWPETKNNVVKNKVWTIEFSQPLDVSSLSESCVYVKDVNNNVFPTKCDLSEDKKYMTVSPLQSYVSEGWYYLYIPQDIMSQGGEDLNMGIRMKFIIEE